MQRQASLGVNSNPFADAAFAASRQVWLAGLGAAAVTRDWARHEAARTFRALVKEGSVVERQAIRVLSDRMETSIATATSVWNQTRATALTTANTLAETAATALARFKTPTSQRSAPATKKARKTIKATKKRTSRATRRSKRVARKA